MCFISSALTFDAVRHTVSSLDEDYIFVENCGAFHRGEGGMVDVAIMGVGDGGL